MSILSLQQLKQMVHGIPHAEHWLEALDQLLPGPFHAHWAPGCGAFSLAAGQLPSGYAGPTEAKAACFSKQCLGYGRFAALGGQNHQETTWTAFFHLGSDGVGIECPGK